MENYVHENEFILIAKYCPKAIIDYNENILPSILEKYSKKIDIEWDKIIEDYKKTEFKETSVYFFTSFAPHDLYIGNTFNSIYNTNDSGVKIRSNSVICAILDEMTLIPIECILRGHRCICMIDFPEGIPSILNNIKEVEKVSTINQYSQIRLCNL